MAAPFDTIQLPFDAHLPGLCAHTEITKFHHPVVAQLCYMHCDHLTEQEISIAAFVAQQPLHLWLWLSARVFKNNQGYLLAITGATMA